MHALAVRAIGMGNARREQLLESGARISQDLVVIIYGNYGIIDYFARASLVKPPHFVNPLISNRAPSDSAVRFTVAEPPLWIENRCAPVPPPDKSALTIALLDLQFHAENGQRYLRQIHRINSELGRQLLAVSRVELRAKSEEIRFHHAVAWRETEPVSLLQHEPFVDPDGVCALELAGLRVGDFVDISYTIADPGYDPGRKFSTLLPLSFPFPAELACYAVHASRDRQLRWITRPEDLEVETSVSEDDSIRVESWSVSRVAASPTDENRPTWPPAEGLLQVSEFADWRETVAAVQDRWATGPAGAQAELEALLEPIRADLNPIEAAIRLVQDEAESDPALLLCSLLDRLSVPARPTLVSAAWAGGLASLLPAPDLLDHALVAYSLNGVTHFVDPSATKQGGLSGTRAAGVFAHGLIIDPGTEGLVDLPGLGGDDGSFLIEESIVFGGEKSGSKLEVRATWTGIEADRLRLRGWESAEIELLKSLAAAYPDLETESGAEIEDDRAANFMGMGQKFRVRGAAPESLVAHSIRARLPRLPGGERTCDLAIPFPLNLTHRITATVPASVRVEPSNLSIEGPGLAFSRAVSRNDNGQIVAEFRFRHTADRIPARAASRYLQKIAEISRMLTVELEIANWKQRLGLDRFFDAA